MQYDSIYIMDHSTERYHPSAFHYDTVVNAYLKVDTIYRDRTQTEYRYRLLHDTTYVQHTDTIPKVITVTQTKYRWPPWGVYLIVIPFVLFILLFLFNLLKKFSDLLLPQL